MAGKYVDGVSLEIDDGNNPIYEVTCMGVGTCILCEPKLVEVLDLGYILTHTLFKKELKFTNKGKKKHCLNWTRNKMGKSNFGKFSVP